jgi:hypothetical protein
MTGPELEDESIRVIRWFERRRQTAFKMALILLVHVAPVGSPDSKPAFRKDSDSTQRFYRIVVKGIRRPPGYVHRRTGFRYQLEVLVDRKVKSDSGQ